MMDFVAKNDGFHANDDEISGNSSTTGSTWAMIS